MMVDAGKRWTDLGDGLEELFVVAHCWRCGIEMSFGKKG